MDDLADAVRADYADMDRLTLVALMVEAGHLRHLPKERRYILSDDAVQAGIGRNVRPRTGYPFPSIYPEHVPMMLRALWTWAWLKGRTASMRDGRERRAYLAQNFRHLPVATLARLAGVSLATMERDLAAYRKSLREAGGRP